MADITGTLGNDTIVGTALTDHLSGAPSLSAMPRRRRSTR
jgi:hypothetical protein